MNSKVSQKTVIIILAVLLVLALIFACVQLNKSSSLRTQLSEAEKTLDATNADLAAASEELESTKSALSEVSSQNEASTGALSVKEAELTEALVELESAKTALESAKTELESVKSELEGSKTELESAKADLESAKTDLESAIASLTVAGADKDAAAQTLSEKESALDSAKAELEEVNGKLQETQEALGAKEGELEAVTAELEALNLKQQETADALAKLNTEHQATVDTLAETEKALAETEEALAIATAVHVHTWGEWVTDMTPTCETEGREIRKCTEDPTHEEMRLIPALGHDWTPATFTQPRHCARCGEVGGKPSPETTFPTREEVEILSHDNTHLHVSEWDKTKLVTPSEKRYLDEPYRVTLSQNIYLMPTPELGHGNLGIVYKGTDVVVVAKLNKYVFFVTYDGRMGWNGVSLVA